MPTIELAALLNHSDTAGRPVILKAAVAAGVLWKCRKSACSHHNDAGEELCRGCGRNSNGQPLSDSQPGPYVAPHEIWEMLREEVRDHFLAQEITPLPDAVTFPWRSDDPTSTWSLTDLVVHHGGRQEPYSSDLQNTEIESALEEVARAVEPGYLEDLRITLQP
ncbi:hypothetical protein [Streptomyces prunicolor]|uniref:hypothetical protein n=1 Tax=Streptomyces prunicolor TaxID=67348 RepID=UPI00036DF935|nr:hypothetical protein [Streptomyces prunicolor]